MFWKRIGSIEGKARCLLKIRIDKGELSRCKGIDTKESRTAYVSLEEEITDYDDDEEKNAVPKGEKRAGTGEEHVEQHGDDHHIPHEGDRHEPHETGPNTVLVEFYSQPGKIKEVRMDKGAPFRSLLPVVRVEGKPSHWDGGNKMLGCIGRLLSTYATYVAC